MMFLPSLFYRILPLVLLDLFNLEQSLSLVFGEFQAQLRGGYPELIAILLDKVISLARKQDHQETVENWTLICLNNFLQIKPIETALWALTYIFLSASIDDKLRSLYPFS